MTARGCGRRSNSVPGGLVLLDRDERVVLASAGYGETYPGLAGVVTPGARFPDVTSATAP